MGRGSPVCPVAGLGRLARPLGVESADGYGDLCVARLAGTAAWGELGCHYPDLSALCLCDGVADDRAARHAGELAVDGHTRMPDPGSSRPLAVVGALADTAADGPLRQ